MSQHTWGLEIGISDFRIGDFRIGDFRIRDFGIRDQPKK